MTRNRLLTYGKDIAFRLQPAQSYQLGKHELIDGEPVSNIINRQLWRLCQAIDGRTAPPEPLPVRGVKRDRYVFAPEQERVEPFIQQVTQARGLPKDGRAVELLLPWSCAMPIVIPILSAEEAYQCWVARFGRNAESVLARSLLLSIHDRCSLEQAKIWLWELSESGKVRLRIPTEGRVIGGLVRLPHGKGKLYCYVDF